MNVLAFSNDNERMYSGDASGIVSITSTRTLRSLIVWPAHTDGLLGVEEWGYTQYGTMISIITSVLVCRTLVQQREPRHG